MKGLGSIKRPQLRSTGEGTKIKIILQNYSRKFPKQSKNTPKHKTFRNTNRCDQKRIFTYDAQDVKNTKQRNTTPKENTNLTTNYIDENYVSSSCRHLKSKQTTRKKLNIFQALKINTANNNCHSQSSHLLKLREKKTFPDKQIWKFMATK